MHVVTSELGGTDGLTQFIKRLFPTFRAELRAQTSLNGATQPELEQGGFHHNTLGGVRLRPTEAAADAVRASRFWIMLKQLAKSS
ncbi:MAG: hypothetical protein AAFO89_00355 [Planctomycetota bacterium]